MWTSSAPRAPIRAVRFDGDGVVQLPRPSWLASLAALCGDPDRTDELLADVFAAEKPCLAGRGDFEPALAAVLRKWRSSAAFFSFALVRIATEPDRTLFIDDDEAKVMAARDGGLHAEVYHLSEGVGRLHEEFRRHGLHIA